MAVVVFLENWEGKFKKNTWEAAQYAAHTAKMAGEEAVGVVIGPVEGSPEEAGAYGVNKVYHFKEEALQNFDNYRYASALAQVAQKEQASTIILSGTFNGKALAPVLAVQREAALITNACELPSGVQPFTVKRSVFSSKGFVDYRASAEHKIVVFIPNSLGLQPGEGQAVVEELTLEATDLPQVQVTEVDRIKGQIPLPEAEKVVSGGRGLKGPENWGMLEKLAEVLDAGTACSKPVSDMGWRPHTEHVGQTGIAINPNLYVAVGISGAIQHLAGVSSSKVIVAINNDAEAPFFKAADYGVVGDAFEVIPRLTEAVEKFKQQN